MQIKQKKSQAVRLASKNYRLIWTAKQSLKKNNTNPDFKEFVLFTCGGDKGIRTPDLYDANVSLYQLSHIPKHHCIIKHNRDDCKRFFIFHRFSAIEDRLPLTQPNVADVFPFAFSLKFTRGDEFTQGPFDRTKTKRWTKFSNTLFSKLAYFVLSS